MTTVSARRFRIAISTVGTIFFLIPFGFRWYVSDAARYAALQRGPAPWNYLGNLAYQLIGTIVAPALVAAACALVALSFKDQVHFDHAPMTRRAVTLQLTAVIIAAFALAATLILFLTSPTGL